MSASIGWRIHIEDENTLKSNICASMWSKDGDIITVKGFVTRLEAILFISSYMVLMSNAKSDRAMQMLQEFIGRVQ